MFEIPEKLVLEQSDVTFGVSQISWQNSPCKHSSLVNDEAVLSLSHAEVYVFSDSVLCLGKVNQNPASNTAWEQQMGWFKDSPQYRTLDTIDGQQWNIYPGFTTLQLVQEVQKFMNKMSEPEQFQGRLIFLSMFKDIIWWIETLKRNVLLMPHLCLYSQNQQDIGHSSDLDRKQSDIPPTTKDYKENGIESLNWWWSKFRDSGHPVFRATSPLSRGTLKSKGGGKLSIRFCADGDTIETVFRTIIFVYQLDIYGAVSDVRNTVPVKQERWDPYWQDNLTHCSSQHIYW